MTEPLTVSAEEVRRNRWLMGLSLSPIAAIVPLVVLGIAVNPAFLIPIFHSGIFGAVGAYLIWNWNPLARRVPVQVAIEGDEVVLRDEDGKTTRIPRASIARGDKLRGPLRTSVYLSVTRALDAHLEMLEPKDAEALLVALGLDARSSTARFSGMSRVYTSGWRLAGLGVGMAAAMLGLGAASAVIHQFLPAASPLIGLLGLLLPLAFVTALLARTRIDVGGDGVACRWLGFSWFVPHDDIARVEVTEHGFGRSRRKVVVLHRKSGDPINLPTGAPRFDGKQAELLAARIHEAQAARAAGPLPPQSLVRGNRSHHDWVAALRRRDADLRTNAPNKDDLFQVLESASASPTDRSAAAVALGKELTDADRERLRAAAKVVAAPKLRVVLEQAPDAENEDVAAMLEAVEAESKRA